MVKIFSRDSCAPCKTLKYWLNKKGITYEELEPTDDITIVPTILIGEHRIEGLNLPRLAELLEV